MKAKIYDSIKLLVNVKSEFTGKIIQKGTKGVIVEYYKVPREGYAVDLCILNEAFVGGYEYENVILFPHQFGCDDSQPVHEKQDSVQSRLQGDRHE